MNKKKLESVMKLFDDTGQTLALRGLLFQIS